MGRDIRGALRHARHEGFFESLPSPTISTDGCWRNIVEVLFFAPELIVQGDIIDDSRIFRGSGKTPVLRLPLRTINSFGLFGLVDLVRFELTPLPCHSKKYQSLIGISTPSGEKTT